MISEPSASQEVLAPGKRRSRRKRWAIFVVGLLLVYFAAAYVIAPHEWMRYARKHPSLDDIPGITQTADGIPGDPLNVALIGTKTQIESIMKAAEWNPAAALALESDLKIAADSVLVTPG